MKTESESESRKTLGLFLRKFREDYFLRTRNSQEIQLSRKRLAGRVLVNESVIINLEHGVPNPGRSVFEKVIKALKLSNEDSTEAYIILDLFSGKFSRHKRKRVKFHLYFDARVRRHPRTYGRY